MFSLRQLIILLPLLSLTTASPHKRKVKVKRNTCKPKTTSAVSNANLVASAPTSSSVFESPASIAVVGVTPDTTASSPATSDASSARSEENTDSFSSGSPVIYTNPLGTSAAASTTVSSSVPAAVNETFSSLDATQEHNSTSTSSGAVEPSATASSNASGSAGGITGKAGIGWAAQEGDAAPVALFFTPGSGVKWWFNWAKNWNQGVMQADGTDIDGQFIPMLFDSVSIDNGIPLQDGFTELMGYNEPDLKDKDVAVYLEPKAAAELWKPQITQIRENFPSVKIHSPVVASNTSWLKAFFDEICPNNTAEDAWGNCAYRPDYVSQHVYSTNVGHFRGAVQQYYKTFGLPIVLSEWACHDWSKDGHRAPVEEVSEFMEETMGWLDQQDYVVKYAWFGTARSAEHLHGVYENNRLMDEAGNITPLGRQYMNGGKKV
ncbi:hypothetical protein IAT40_000904 [Kwoniella sp. CBS 6097]